MTPAPTQQFMRFIALPQNPDLRSKDDMMPREVRIVHDQSLRDLWQQEAWLAATTRGSCERQRRFGVECCAYEAKRCVEVNPLYNLMWTLLELEPLLDAAVAPLQEVQKAATWL